METLVWVFGLGSLAHVARLSPFFNKVVFGMINFYQRKNTICKPQVLIRRKIEGKNERCTHFDI